MKKNIIIAFLAVSSVFVILKNDYTLSQTIRDELKMYMGVNHTIAVSNPTRIAIGNPAVADVAQVSKKEMTIVPKAVGSTTLVYWDNFGEQSYVVKVYSEDMQEVKRRIDSAIERLKLKGIQTKSEDEEAKVFILGKFKTQSDKDKLMLAMGPLKDKTVDLASVKEDETVVEIDVQVLELQKGSSSSLGFSWPGSINITEIAAPGIASSAASWVGGATGGEIVNTAGGGTTWGRLFKMGSVARDAYSLKLDALIQEGKARVLSRPRLSCQSGKEAKLLVGGEVPILSSSVTGGGTQGTTATPGSVEYKEYGIKLNIKPRVDPSDRIHLNVEVEVSEVGTAVTTSYALAYPIVKRTASTELFVDNGQTMAIGGLIKQKTEEELRKFPWLADVPVLGMFFRQRTNTTGDNQTTRGDSELFITLTPRIVSKPVDVDDTEEKEVKAKPLPVVDELMLDPEVKYAHLVKARIMDRLRYPPAAKGAGFQGTTELVMRLSYKGELLEAKIDESSGYKILDDNALKTAKSITSYPPFPPKISAKDIWIEVPIVYQID
jgi:pilus assembly protein CpaC